MIKLIILYLYPIIKQIFIKAYDLINKNNKIRIYQKNHYYVVKNFLQNARSFF